MIRDWPDLSGWPQQIIGCINDMRGDCMNDSEQVEWLQNFLWHWQDSEVLTCEAAGAILRNLQQASEQKQSYRLPDPESLLKTLGSG